MNVNGNGTENEVWWKQRAMYRWMLEPSDRDAVLANVAIKKEKELQVIVELGTVLSSEELIGVRRAYHHRYKHSLEEEIADKTTGHLRQACHPLSLSLSTDTHTHTHIGAT